MSELTVSLLPAAQLWYASRVPWVRGAAIRLTSKSWSRTSMLGSLYAVRPDSATHLSSTRTRTQTPNGTCASSCASGASTGSLHLWLTTRSICSAQTLRTTTRAALKGLVDCGGGLVKYASRKAP
eukprot:scaffold106740_cov70-Phaeocystis_antarctica.AAC.4